MAAVVRGRRGRRERTSSWSSRWDVVVVVAMRSRRGRRDERSSWRSRWDVVVVVAMRSRLSSRSLSRKCAIDQICQLERSAVDNYTLHIILF